MLACEIITFGVLRIIASDIQQGNPLANDIQQGTSINARAEVDTYLVIGVLVQGYIKLIY